MSACVGVWQREGRGIEMAIFRLSALDERINNLQTELAMIRADAEANIARIKAKLAKLQAVRAQITPEMEKLLAQLNAALE